MSKNIAIIFAGGVGQRFGSQIPKQFVNVYGKNIIIHTLSVFQNHNEIDEIYIGCIEDWIPYLEKLVKINEINKVKAIIPGGSSGQDTIYKILKRAKKDNNDDDDIVLIHDGVRPIVTDKEISDNIKSVKEHGSTITCIPFTETPIYSEDGIVSTKTYDRNKMYRGVAPQSFRLGHILKAHEIIRKNDPDYSKDHNGFKVIDSATLVNAAFNEECYIVKGNSNNLKVTTTGDYFTLLGLLASNDIENYFYGKTDDNFMENEAMREANKIKQKKLTKKRNENNE